MKFFNVAASGSTAVLSSAVGRVHQDTSRSLTVFVVMAAVAGIGCLLAMVGLAGGWKKVVSLVAERAAIVFFSGIALIAILIASIVLHRAAGRKERTPIRVSERRLAHTADTKLPPKRAAVAVPGNPEHVKQITPPVVVPSRVPVPRQSKEKTKTVTRAAMRPEADVKLAERRAPDVATTQPAAVARVVHQTLPSRPPLPKKDSIVVHGVKALSEIQTRQICGAVSAFAGTQVYIKWSPGANPEQFASQLSKAMDCARVTVTYASVAGALGGRGVRVGSHADEGETSDRLRPFADAITAALREQGFTVTEVSGATIPADQTAIFIGPE